MEINSQILTGLISKSSLKNVNDLIEQLKSQREELEALSLGNSSLVPVQTSITTTTRIYETLWEKIWNIFNKDIKSSTFALLKTTISQYLLKQFGIQLLKKNVVERPWHGAKFTRALSSEEWSNYKESLKNDERYTLILQKLKIQYEKHLNQKIDKELQQVSVTVDENLRNAYKAAYFRTPISFNTFMEQNQNTISSSTSSTIRTNQGEAKQIRAKYERALEQKKLESEKKEQENKFDNYQTYFTMDERELARAKRQGDLQRRAVAKKSRRDKWGDD
jgi:hypothetical protein